MNKKYKSEMMESIHESARALFAIGAISSATMRDFDDSCLDTVPAKPDAKAEKHCPETRFGDSGLNNQAEP
jgi:putative transcriptional regulator